MDPQIVVAANPLVADPGLRRGLDPVLFHEGIGFLACRQVMILNLVPFAFEQVLGLQAIGAKMIRHDHPVELG